MLDAERRFFAEELQAVANLRTPGLVDAFAAVPRERFLSEGPWTVKSDADIGGPPRRSPDGNPRHVSIGKGIMAVRLHLLSPHVTHSNSKLKT